MKRPASLKGSENSLSEDFTTYNFENEDECMQEGKKRVSKQPSK